MKKIVMTRKDFFAEHKKLINLLRSQAKALNREADSQAKEAKKYRK